MYSHIWSDGSKIDLPIGKAVCVGRNYVEHAKELDNPIPDNPILFIKPKTSIVRFDRNLTLNKKLGAHHFEAELALLVGETITRGTVSPLQCIVGVGLALDITLREVQNELKAKGHPWERAKAYDSSCPVTAFHRCSLSKSSSYEYRFWQNGELKQHGDSALMLFPLERLLREISQSFTLEPGDIVLTGTPKGVDVLNDGDELTLQLLDYPPAQGQVAIE
ncbi:fumarylacetoacetate hydrolase family protein [Pseudoalteromonas xiamenensis]